MNDNGNPSALAWSLIGAVALGVLFVLRHALEALMGKYVLRLLRLEKETLAALLEGEVLKEKVRAINEAAELAKAHEDSLCAVQESVEAHGRELRTLVTQTGGLAGMNMALVRLAETQELMAQSVDKLVITMARMEEREAMREKWDGISERRVRERRAGF